MQALVGFQPVASVPVAAAFDEGFGAVDVLFYGETVAEEDTYSDDSEDKVDFSA